MQEEARWGTSHTPHKVCVPAALNHLLKELVLHVAPSLTPDKLEQCSGLWKKHNPGELTSFLVALGVYQFSVSAATSSSCLNMLDYL